MIAARVVHDGVHVSDCPYPECSYCSNYILRSRALVKVLSSAASCRCGNCLACIVAEAVRKERDYAGKQTDPSSGR